MATRKYTGTEAPHIGNMLEKRIIERRISVNGVARILDRSNVTVRAYRKRASLQTSILWELCQVMKHNFFMDLAAQLPPTFTTYAPDPTAPLREKIAQLEHENLLLKTQVETLLKIAGK
ncbi:hypothetical protein [Aequorivita echinoideorum]|uniref:HTH cro/C1-type domain-containing protein n=1 Tax=Aequorivita echinoideorum TaxID=1549647 RepID=A0ABS5S7Q5_9FLAO|nr:hypothetical protein [Aequorivita echinoideorum]MBT0609242.1 hypothetical protein [Aequorivita echinoideorum]